MKRKSFRFETAHESVLLRCPGGRAVTTVASRFVETDFQPMLARESDHAAYATAGPARLAGFAATQKWREIARPFRRSGFADFLEFAGYADDELR